MDVDPARDHLRLETLLTVVNTTLAFFAVADFSVWCSEENIFVFYFFLCFQSFSFPKEKLCQLKKTMLAVVRRRTLKRRAALIGSIFGRYFCSHSISSSVYIFFTLRLLYISSWTHRAFTLNRREGYSIDCSSCRRARSCAALFWWACIAAVPRQRDRQNWSRANTPARPFCATGSIVPSSPRDAQDNNTPRSLSRTARGWRCCSGWWNSFCPCDVPPDL